MTDEPPADIAGGEEIALTVEQLRSYFDSGTTRNLNWRIAQLVAIERLVQTEQDAIEAALAADLGKPASEAWLSEVVTVLGEVRELRRGLRRWSHRERVGIPFVLQPGRAAIEREPVGVVLVIAPWNYPLNLVLVPAASAIAAGNCVVVKPSELAPATSNLLSELVPRYLDAKAVAVVEGGPKETQLVIGARVDHVFFTGSTAVGRKIMATAASSLTPVTLELGGKSPAIVDGSADLKAAAQRIAWGKFLNAGQTCIAPDYVLVQDDLHDQLVKNIGDCIVQFYGNDPKKSESFARIVNRTHVDRLEGLLSSHGGKMIVGGVVDKDDRYVAPTLISRPELHSALMSEEIFGPILPIITYKDINDAISVVRSLPTPLALYLFSRDQTVIDVATSGTRSGTICINTTLEQFAIPRLPFGGLGNSGIGSYHGRFGFEALSHRRAIFRRPARLPMQIIYPPYKKWKRVILRKFL